MSHKHTDRVEAADPIWAELARSRDPQLREKVILRYAPLASFLAGRFAGRGREQEDVEQAAMLGLIRAVDRFDPDLHHQFSTFATPIILGQIKDYFEVASWRLHVPRRLKELARRIDRLSPLLAQDLGRAPTPSELAEALGTSEEETARAASLIAARCTVSLDLPAEEGESVQAPGEEDRELERAENRLWVAQELSKLPERLREVIRLRYVAGETQRRVAEALGISPAHVHRLERRALHTLRLHLRVVEGR